MVVPEPKRRGPKPKPRIRARDVRGAKYLRGALDLLRRLRAHRDCPNRKLHFDEYAAYVLLYFFNPIVTSMRGLQQVSTLRKIQRKLGLPRFSLGSFSEARNVFDPALLVPLIEQLAAEAGDLGNHPKLSALDKVLTAVDGTLLDALPKMVWALWLDDEHRAAKMHLEYRILEGVAASATVTEGNGNERTALRERLSAGKLYVLDAGYAEYALLAAIADAKSSFVVRVRTNAVYEVVEERAVSASAQKACVVRRDLLVRLGCADTPALHDRTVRLVELRVRDEQVLLGRKRRCRRPDRKTKTHRKPKAEYTVLVVTDLLDLDAELVAEIYRSRWQIELFFRWFKVVLGAEHLLAHSRNGVTLMVYCALIASLLLTLWTGSKPTKRTFEMICLFLAGWADEDEVVAHIETLGPAVD
jgi:hypothetical protein